MVLPIAYGKNLSADSQGLILDALLFNIFLYDLFSTIEGNYFTNYAVDTTLYVISNNAEEVVSDVS